MNQVYDFDCATQKAVVRDMTPREEAIRAYDAEDQRIANVAKANAGAQRTADMAIVAGGRHAIGYDMALARLLGAL